MITSQLELDQEFDTRHFISFKLYKKNVFKSIAPDNCSRYVVNTQPKNQVKRVKCYCKKALL